MTTHTPCVLTIGGFDSSGGAGIQADLKVFAALGCYGLSVLTALPIQSTCGVRQTLPLPFGAVAEQLHCILDDQRPDAIKLGMLFDTHVIESVAEVLKSPALSGVPVVLDPVMVAKSGDRLLRKEAVKALMELIFPHATVITPNLPEVHALLPDYSLAELASGDVRVMEAARRLAAKGPRYVLIKGGHRQGEQCRDYLLSRENTAAQWLISDRIETRHTHGTGCTLASAIAAGLAHRRSVPEAVRAAKAYLGHALAAGPTLAIGRGIGPLDHFYFADKQMPPAWLDQSAVRIVEIGADANP